jgi:enhancing lycopene biosynthesis protein 2
MSKKIAVVLSGCGVYDGSEIHESVLTLLALSRRGAIVQCFAPDVDQLHVIDHLSGDVSGESRNVLRESARIARGKIAPLSDYKAADYDAIVFPGGFGAAKNLCTFAVDGTDCKVNPDVERAIKDTRAANKPIGALCIAPVILAKLVAGAEVTIGSDADTAAAIESMGGKHSVTTHGEIVVDKTQKLVTTPCYMLDATVAQIAEGADNAVEALLEMS